MRAGDTFVVPKLDRLARSVPDARAIAEELELRGVRLQLGSSIHDPRDPMGRMFFNVLATFAEFEADLLSMRTREGMAVASARGRLKGKPPKLSVKQQQHLVKLHAGEEKTIPELAELFGVSRATVYRVLERRAKVAKGQVGQLVPGARSTPSALRCRVHGDRYNQGLAALDGPKQPWMSREQSLSHQPGSCFAPRQPIHPHLIPLILWKRS